MTATQARAPQISREPSDTAARRALARQMRWKEYGSALAFLAPALLLFAGFVVFPIVYNVQASLLNWDGVAPGSNVGAANYQELLADPIVHTAIKNSALWIPITILAQGTIGFLLAIALNRPMRGRAVYRAVFFVPAILSPIVVGFVWQRILDPFSGVLSAVGGTLGLGSLGSGALADPQTAIFGVMAVNIWMWTGFSMLFYLAGLQLIDRNVLDAAKIDGASSFQTTTRVVLPLLKSTHLSLLLLGVIGSLKTFELIYILTQGGPANASQMLPTFAFQEAFPLQRVGYGAAISVVLLVVSIVSSLLMVRSFGSGFITGEEQ